MLFLLDTNALSDLMGAHPKIQSRLAALPTSDKVITCAIVRGEILYGIDRLAPGKKREQLRDQADSMFQIVTCEPMPKQVGDEYARIKLACQRKGLPLDANDLWVAATALAIDGVLVTRDSDFHKVDDLVVQDWTR